jgi:hypothetical protein
VSVGLARLSPLGRTRAALLVLTVSLAATIAVGPWPVAVLGASNWDNLGTLDTAPRHIRALQRAVALVPDDAPVSATNRAGAHLSARRYVYSVPVVGRAEWIVMDVADAWVPHAFGGRVDPGAVRDFRRSIERSPEWRTVLEEDGVLVFRKVQE